MRQDAQHRTHFGSADKRTIEESVLSLHTPHAGCRPRLGGRKLSFVSAETKAMRQVNLTQHSSKPNVRVHAKCHFSFHERAQQTGCVLQNNRKPHYEKENTETDEACESCENVALEMCIKIALRLRRSNPKRAALLPAVCK